MARVIISSGHTSADPGVVSGNLKEYELTRKIANAIIPHLRSQGLITLSVPPELDLAKRIEWINSTGYRESLNDISVEIHINDGGKSGIEGWFKEEGGNKSEDLAKKILEESAKETGLQNQGAKSEYTHELGTLAFVHNSNAVSVLLECLYIDNDSDREFLSDENKIELLGKGIAKGIVKFLNIDFREDQKTVEEKDGRDDPVVPANKPTPPPISSGTLLQTNTASTQPSLSSGFPAPAGAPGGGFGGGGAGNTLGSSFGGAMGGGGFGGGTYNSSGFGAAGGGLGAGSGSNFMQSRDDRKKMVEETYKKVLGREASQNDLNYFLNIGITEDQLTKRMIDSQEHADLVKARQEVIETKDKFDELSAKHLELETRTNDQEEIIKSLNTLLAQKNRALSEINTTLHEYERKKMKKQLSSASENQPSGSVTASPYRDYKPSLSDRIFKFFSDIFE